MVRRQQVDLFYNDSPGATGLEILKIDLGISPSFSTIKAALLLLADYVREEVTIPRPQSPFDCTGRTFTSSIELLKCSIECAFNE